MVQLAGSAALVAVLLLVVAMSSAGGGWYLLVPPRSEYNERAQYLSGYKIFDRKPLSQWNHEGAYDTASECEAVRAGLMMTEQGVYSLSSDEYIKLVAAAADPVVVKLQRYLTETNNARLLAFMGSRCAASDDPRLR
jgi:hypothetical protein